MTSPSLGRFSQPGEGCDRMVGLESKDLGWIQILLLDPQRGVPDKDPLSTLYRGRNAIQRRRDEPSSYDKPWWDLNCVLLKEGSGAGHSL